MLERLGSISKHVSSVHQREVVENILHSYAVVSFAQIGQIVSVRVKTLSNADLVAPKLNIKRENDSPSADRTSL